MTERNFVEIFPISNIFFLFSVISQIVNIIHHWVVKNNFFFHLFRILFLYERTTIASTILQSIDVYTHEKKTASTKNKAPNKKKNNTLLLQIAKLNIYTHNRSSIKFTKYSLLCWSFKHIVYRTDDFFPWKSNDPWITTMKTIPHQNAVTPHPHATCFPFTSFLFFVLLLFSFISLINIEWKKKRKNKNEIFFSLL